MDNNSCPSRVAGQHIVWFVGEHVRTYVYKSMQLLNEVLLREQ